MAERSHLSIGEVLSLLQGEFPDVTISKIRFLESQGLLDPERTPSGYRKFYEADIERLRWILRQQRENFLPLKVIRDRLDDADRHGLVVPHDEGGQGVPAGSELAPATTDADRAAPSLVAATTGASPAPRRTPAPAEAASLTAPPALPAVARAEARPVPQVAGGPRTASPSASPETPSSQPTSSQGAPGAPDPGSNPLDAGPSAVSLTAAELGDAAGLDGPAVSELERFGLLVGHHVGADVYYDGDALVVARTAAAFLRHGIEARHLRMYKVAAEREAGFFEQVVMPLLKQRNPASRRQAHETLAELAALGETLRAALLRAALDDHRR